MEIVEKGGNSCAVIKKQPFWNYAGNRSEFMRLNIKDREKVFLRWKHGSKDYEANLAVELTDKYLIERITQENISTMKEFDKWYWTMEKKWWERCKEIRQEIGLISEKTKTRDLLNSVKVDPETKEISEMFNGEVTGWDE